MSFQFNSDSVTLDTSHDVIPAGMYVARITEAKFAPLKSGNGNGVSFTFEVIDGPARNRKIWVQASYQHTNPTAQKIAQETLKKISDAVGVKNWGENTAHLLYNRPMSIKVSIRKDDQYGDKNEIKAFEAIGGAGAMPPIQTQQAATAAFAPAAAGPKPSPWAK